MRRPSSFLFNQSVTVRTFTYSNNLGRQVRASTEVAMAAAIQPRSTNRRVDLGGPQGVTDYVIYFATDPSIKVDDQVVWGTRTLAARGASHEAAGQARIWQVDCQEIK